MQGIEGNDLRDVDQLLMTQAVGLNSMYAGLVQLGRKKFGRLLQELVGVT